MHIARRLVVYGLVVAAVACQKESAEEHLRRATAYVADAHYAEAIVEYRSAAQIAPARGDIRLALGDAYLRVNDPRGALREYVRAADLLHGNIEAQLKAGNMLLVAQAFQDANSRAGRALAIDATNIEAQILRGNALASLKDLDAAIAEYEDVIAQDPSRNEAYLSLGAIQFVQGKAREAEETFKKAIESAPKAMAPRLALANFYWASRRQNESERILRAALDLEPKDVGANRALGVLYMVSGRSAEAEPYFRTLASVSGTSTSKLTLAQYYATVRRFDDARRVLEETATRKESYATASVRLAALDMIQGRRAEARTRVGQVLAKYPQDVNALLLDATVLAIDRKRDEALVSIKTALVVDPKSARAYLLAGHVYADLDRADEAIRAYEQVLKLDPRSIVAAVELTRLNLQIGATDKALTRATQALLLEPLSPEVHNLTARIHLRRGDISKAKAEIALLREAFPNAAPGFTLAALAQLAEKRPEAARASYERALQLDPGNLAAFEGLLHLDLSTGKATAAIARIESTLTRTTPTADLLMVAARGYAGANDPVRSEALLRRAIETDPARLQGYVLLGQLYVKQHRLDEARQEFQDVLTRHPQSVPASTMIGILFEAQGRMDEAERQYRQTLAIDPQAAVAANNLAYLYVSSDRELNQALQLAQAAKQQLPTDPHISDTLGWIYVKRNMGATAVPYLESSARSTPGNPVALYHLGMAYVQSRDWDKAKETLKRALALKPDFEGAAEARKALATIGA